MKPEPCRAHLFKMPRSAIMPQKGATAEDVTPCKKGRSDTAMIQSRCISLMSLDEGHGGEVIQVQAKIRLKCVKHGLGHPRACKRDGMARVPRQSVAGCPAGSRAMSAPSSALTRHSDESSRGPLEFRQTRVEQPFCSAQIVPQIALPLFIRASASRISAKVSERAER